jgi:iron complex transport system permease protein
MKALRIGDLSARVAPRSVLVACALSALTAVVVLVSVSLGDFDIPLGDVAGSLAGSGDPATDFIVLELRLPRAIVGLLAGGALGLAGAVFQQVARNPLVAPDVIGISSGAALAAVSVIVFAGMRSALAVPLAALGGALLTGAALYALAWRRGVSGHRLVLVGIGVSAFMQAGISYVMTEGRIFEVADAYVWMVGTVNGRGWEHVLPLALALAVLTPVILGLGRRLDVLALGDDVARALGLGVERSRALLVGAATVLTALAVAAAGPVGFVAFVAPHLARRLSRAATAQDLLPIAALCGGALVIVADLAARLVSGPTEIPVGLVTSMLAAPYFLVLLRWTPRLGATG